MSLKVRWRVTEVYPKEAKNSDAFVEPLATSKVLEYYAGWGHWYKIPESYAGAIYLEK